MVSAHVKPKEAAREKVVSSTPRPHTSCPAVSRVCMAQGSPQGTAPTPQADHRITESLRFEKTSEIIKSNHHPITTMPAK